MGIPGKGVAEAMLKLLIVDGSEDFRIALADALKGMYIIKTCDDGESALEIARSFGPDLLILDLMISGVDGLSLVQMITEIRGKPMVLATTRFRSPYVMDAATRIGIDYMVIKPCSIQAVTARLEDLAVSRNREEQARPDPGVMISNVLMFRERQNSDLIGFHGGKHEMKNVFFSNCEIIDLKKDSEKLP